MVRVTGKFWLLFTTSHRSYTLPEARQARDGPQTGESTTALGNETPRADKRSRFGVGTGTAGFCPTQSKRCWSGKKNRKLGRVTLRGPGCVWHPASADSPLAPARKARRVGCMALPVYAHLRAVPDASFERS